MCAYTHTGGLHVQRWNSETAVEPVYAPEEVEEVLLKVYFLDAVKPTAEKAGASFMDARRGSL